MRSAQRTVVRIVQVMMAVFRFAGGSEDRPARIRFGLQETEACGAGPALSAGAERRGETVQKRGDDREPVHQCQKKAKLPFRARFSVRPRDSNECLHVFVVPCFSLGVNLESPLSGGG